MSIQIVGYSDTNKVPGFYGETVFGAGPISAGDIPLKLLLVGTKLSTGTATPDQDINQIFSTSDTDTLHAPGSELNVMCRAALQIPGVSIWAAPNAEAGGAAGATATITIAGTWTAGGTFIYRIDGVRVSGTFVSTDTIATAAAAVVSAINAIPQISVVAVRGAATAYVITLTRKSKGARGNQGVLAQDISQLPSGMTSTIAGGSALTGGAVPFTGGTGADSVANVIALLASSTFDRIAVAQNDSTNGALWSTYLTTQAGPLVGITEHMVMANNATLSASTSIAQTSLNAERIQYMWLLNSETIPSFIAAVFAAMRTSQEQGNPNVAYDGAVLPGVAPQAFQADWPSTNTLISALNNSITPIATNQQGQAYVVRSITSHSLSGSNPDYRTLDTSQATTPDYVRLVLKLFWLTVFKPANPKVNADPEPTEKARPAGVATPTLWNQQATKQLLDLESQLIITDVRLNPMVTEFNTVAKRLMSIVPVVPTANDHAIGVSVRAVG